METKNTKLKTLKNWLLFVITMVAVFLLGLLASNIMERRAEAVFAYTPQVQHSDFEPRNEVWGKNFPREYQSYKKTRDTSFRSKYNGSAMIDMLAVDPRMVVLWAGYPFASDYNQGRGHNYAVEDVHNTLRVGSPLENEKSPLPNTCWTCKSPDVPRIMQEIGVAEFYKGTWETRGHEVVNAIGCADCHDAQTMNLRISRPALVEAFQRNGKDISEVSHQEMRSLVCAQCHVEYYFNKKIIDGVQYLVFPWDKGMSVEQMEHYYDSIDFSDWKHALSQTPMLKAQHPCYETYLTGVHAKRGVSCADCHMPYISEGGQKFTDHHVQSPLNNISNSCQVCHREESERLIADVYERQDRIIENRDELEKLLVRAHIEAKQAWAWGAKEAQMQGVLKKIRHAQWRWDFAAASHGASFHSPVEISRIVGTGITIVQEARLSLARVFAQLGHNEEIEYPDISTKTKAQNYIGLEVDKMKQKKELFKEKILPQWKAKADEREKNYKVKNL